MRVIEVRAYENYSQGPKRTQLLSSTFGPSKIEVGEGIELEIVEVGVDGTELEGRGIKVLLISPIKVTMTKSNLL